MGRDYLLTEGITPLLTERYGLDLSPSARAEIDALEREFSIELEAHVPIGLDYHVLDANEIRAAMERITREETLPLVSLDDVYFAGLAHGSLSVTRLTSTDEPDRYEIGPRPGSPSLDEQVDAVLTSTGRRIALIDVGAFNGDTIHDQARVLSERYGMQVEGVYVSIANEGAQNGLPMRAAHRFDFHDWVENRDLIGFDGRKPLGDHPGDGYPIMPYFEHLEAWASLPATDELAATCVAYRDRMIGELERDGIATRIERDDQSGIYRLTFDRQVLKDEAKPR